jgi:adenylate cyclase
LVEESSSKVSVKRAAAKSGNESGRERRSSRSLPVAALIAAAAAFVAFLLSLLPSLAVFENKSLDLRFQWRGTIDRSGSDIVLIYVDEDSLEFFEDSLGMWPWPREIWGHLLDYIGGGGARAVLFDLFFFEPDIENAASDRYLAEAMGRSGIDYHAFTLTDGGQEPPPNLTRHSRTVEGKPPPLHNFSGGDLPVPFIVENAAGLGAVNFTPDADGPARRAILLTRYRDLYYPSLPLAAAADILAGRRSPLTFTADGDLLVGDRPVPLTPSGQFLVNWQGGLFTYPHFSVGEVIDSLLKSSRGGDPAVPASIFQDKVVLVGTTAVGLKDLRPNPFHPEVPGVDLHATIIDNILRGDFLRQADHPWPLLLCLLLASPVSFMIILGQNRRILLLAASLLLLLYPVTAHLLFLSADLWVPLIFPMVAGFLSFTASYVYNYATEAREKKFIKNALGRCVPTQVADEIARNPDFLRIGAGERRVVTTLFTDIRGFTPLTEKLAPEQVCHMLIRYFTAMVDVIFAHKGTVKQFVGDEIMVIFGAPQDQPDLRTGIGLNTGDVVSGFMGSEQRLEYAVVGDPVNLASRLEGLTKEYQVPIIISSHTLKELKGLAAVEELDTVQVKGKKEPVTIYHLKGMRDDTDQQG